LIRKEKREKILLLLEKKYHDTRTALVYHSPFELLVAVILSAQCTDERVNMITKRIFPRLNTPKKMLKLSLAEMEDEIRDCGLYHAKAKNLLGMAQMLHEKFNDIVPSNIDTLMKLPGVGRKTANVVASVIYNVPAIAVDTHVFRVSHRLRLASGATPEDTEKELQKVIPIDKWSSAHHWLIWHGRLVCKARNPLCEECDLRHLCGQNCEF